MNLFRIILLTAILACAALVTQYFYPDTFTIKPEKLALAILLPDQADLKDAKLNAWLDAAKEEGIELEIVSASAFLRPFPFNVGRFSGLILPDSIHTVMSETLIAGIHNYVNNGGKLMLVFDAGTLLMPNNIYAKHKSMFADLAGIDYALYDDLKQVVIDKSPVFGNKASYISLNIPPGKYFSENYLQQANTNNEMSLYSYQYGELKYSHFATSGIYNGKALLTTQDKQLIAGINHVQKGDVFFVNLPLGYLKTRTDGALLHGFLRYFALEIANLPFLSAVPNGRGGLVMNLHIDSGANLPALEELKNKSKLFNYGPYSIHITAGPDVDKIDDHLGFNITDNTLAKTWVSYFQQRHYTIGSHGGWIHNYFGHNVNETNQEEFEPYLIKNQQALENLTQQAISEYSAPLGNHPLWTTNWLDKHHFNSYYFTGDIGLGPTRPYRNEQKQAHLAWAFPVLNMGQYASFEEMQAAGIDEQTVSLWLRDITDFTTQKHVARLMYFHPPGILHYQKAADAWLLHAEGLTKSGKFSWYTMHDIANFMSEREKTSWTLTKAKHDQALFSANNAETLAQQSWFFPKSAYGQPHIQNGNAAISSEAEFWTVTVLAGNNLQLNIPLQEIQQ